MRAMNKKLLNQWVAIFKGGNQTDSSGRSHDGSALIDKAVASFNAADHEPPLVIGHPNENAPAWGWVSELKRDGDTLLAKFKNVQADFADLVEQGMYKKRSASFYPDGKLRHVGFLGAVPPAVRGLPDIAFAEGDSITFDFAYDHDLWWRFDAIADWFTRMREFCIEKEGVEAADKLYPSWTIESLRRPLEKPSSDGNFNDQPTEESSVGDGTGDTTNSKSFSQEEMAAAVKQAEANFTEKAKRQQANRDFVEAMEAEGRVTPAMLDAGLVETLNYMDSQQEASVNFSDGSSRSAIEVFKGVLKAIPKQLDFNEAAGAASDPGAGGGQEGSSSIGANEI